MTKTLTALAFMLLSGCSTISLDLSTKYGALSFGTDGKSATVGFKSAP
jgi:uncharacterized protein YceK